MLGSFRSNFSRIYIDVFRSLLGKNEFLGCLLSLCNGSVCKLLRIFSRGIVRIHFVFDCLIGNLTRGLSRRGLSTCRIRRRIDCKFFGFYLCRL